MSGGGGGSSSSSSHAASPAVTNSNSGGGNPTRKMTRKQQIAADLVVHIQSHQIGQMLQFCERVEVNANPNDLGSFYWSAFLTGYIANNDTINAKFLWKRLPKSLKNKVPQLKAIWTIGQAILTKKPSAVYKSMTGYNWETNLKPLMIIAKNNYRKDTIELISKSYSHLSLADTLLYTGWTAQECSKNLIGYGWTFDAKTKYFTTKFIDTANLFVETTSNMDRIRKLSNNTVFLELN